MLCLLTSSNGFLGRRRCLDIIREGIDWEIVDRTRRMVHMAGS